MDDDNEYDDVEWDDDENEDNDDDNELIGDVKCLFCDEVFKSASLLFEHCKEQHNFDIKEICVMWKLDCISYIKMINYIRKMVRPLLAYKRKVREIPPWSNDEYMKPADCEDLLLQYGMLSLIISPI
ncbi:hypothetical protein LOTGIDRAFT_107985 [Lottia gigantea]|uniref:type I protein arginine methyltransferase n=1 Tax=Lottia gigantea TaxID=225164 RepID=V3ZNB8_LOTGI|nr:hypothetical protein LOTGIDRAFT_107985 [Lottia gigantea]ESO83945.1 hypothetical protein LOTGIDRAFT_107985 [Lottia gigantea]